jgi:hypothetical protein
MKKWRYQVLRTAGGEQPKFIVNGEARDAEPLLNPRARIGEPRPGFPGFLTAELDREVLIRTELVVEAETEGWASGLAARWLQAQGDSYRTWQMVGPGYETEAAADITENDPEYEHLLKKRRPR